MKELIRSAVLAGFAVGIAGFGFLALGGLAGAVLFSFGLLTVVGYKLKLYTGTAGFVTKDDFAELGLILIGNVTGCLLVALMTRVSPLPLQDAALKIVEGRVGIGPLRCGVLAIGCGFIMTTAVTFARKKNYLPLLFGVPLFIFCGFPHCLADAFYCLSAPAEYLKANWAAILCIYVAVVAGNFIGCNLYRLICWKWQD